MWNCKFCGYENTSYPSVCEICDNVNEDNVVRKRNLPKPGLLPVMHDDNLLDLQLINQLSDKLSGLFIADHQGCIDVKKVRSVYKNYLGVNFLQTQLTDLPTKLHDIDAVWIDDIKLRNDRIGFESLQLFLPIHAWPGAIFGSVGFKYQEIVKDYDSAVSSASQVSDVLVTSGSATGVAVDLQHLHKIVNRSKKPVGVASGVDISNIRQTACDYYLVHTSIVDKNNRLDGEKICKLYNAMKF